MREPRIAIAGATGMVGQEFMRILEQRDFPVARLRLLASERSRGKSFDFRGETLPVEVLDEESFDGIDICLLYTSDAADDLLCVDLGGRRIIKKKKERIKQQEK